MKSKFKRALALCLALVMILSLMIVSTGAAAANPFSLEISDNGDGTLTVSLVCQEAVAAFGAADGVMSYNSKYFTLQSIRAGALQDLTANVEKGRFAASAEDYTKGDSMAAGAVWLSYVFKMADSVPDGKYDFNLTFTNGVDVNFQSYAWSDASVSAGWRVGAGNFTLEVEAEGTDTLVASLIGLKAVSAFGAADAVIDWNDHSHITLQSIEGVALKDLTANVETGRFAASAEDYAKGDDLAANAVWAKYTFKVDPATPSGTYTFTVSFTNGVDVSFQSCVWSADKVVGSYTLEASPAVNEAAVAAAKKAIEEADWIVEQAAANDEKSVKAWVEARLAELDLGTVEAVVTMTGVTPAVAGSEADEAGKAGSFRFTVALTLNEASDTATVDKGVITPTAYVPALTWQKALADTLDFIQTVDPAPEFGNSDWFMLSLARSGTKLTKDYVAQYTDSAAKAVAELTAAIGGEKLDKNKSTENARLILALSALGVDPRDVDGHDLTAALSDLTFVQRQGFNGPVWALIALDANDYEISTLTGGGTQTTREGLVSLILDKQLADGGWALSGSSADADMTAMVLTALAPYVGSDAKVKAAADKAVALLASMQRADGHYGNYYGEVCSETTAQVIVALSALGIDAGEDERFIKNGVSAVDALLDFFVEGGGFEHMLGVGLDGVATEQGTYALVAYSRFKDGKTRLFDMSDVFGSETPPEEDETLVTVIFHLNGGTAAGVTDGAEKTYTKSEDGARLPAASKSGSTFQGWFDAESGGKQYEEVSADLPKDLYAQWKENSSGGGEGSGGGSSGDKIKVTFRLIGAELAKKDVDLGAEEYMPDYVTWIPTAMYELDRDSTVYDLFTMALDNAGLRYTITNRNNYVETIYAPKGYALSEFTNGARSGWMYSVNGVHVSLGLSQQKLSDGDKIIWHYVNDFSYEVADWVDDGKWQSLGDGRYYNRWFKAPDRAGGYGGGLGEGAQAGGGGGDSGSSEILPSYDGDTVVITADVDHSEGGMAYAADATLTKELAEEGLEKAEDKSKLKVWVEIEDSNRLVLRAEPGAMKVIADAKAGLRVSCSKGVIEMDADAVAKLAETGREVRMVVSYNDWYEKTTVSVSPYPPTEEDPGIRMKIELPVTKEGQALSIVNGDGTTTPIKKSAIIGDRVYAEVPSGVTVTITESDHYWDDVKEKDWFAGAVSFVVSHKLMNGVDRFEFAPNAPMTRAMLVTVLYRLEDEPEFTGGLASFPDVDVKSWYAEAVAWASESGLVNGTENGFEPNANITREQIATILYRYAKYIGLVAQDSAASADMSVFNDGDKVSSWAQEAMAWAVEVGLFKGDDTGSLNPQGNATRAEVATLLERLIKLIVTS